MSNDSNYNNDNNNNKDNEDDVAQFTCQCADHFTGL